MKSNQSRSILNKHPTHLISSWSLFVSTVQNIISTDIDTRNVVVPMIDSLRFLHPVLWNIGIFGMAGN